MTFLEQFLAARKGATPLLAVRTTDPISVMNTIVIDVAARNVEVPLLCWDMVRGLLGLNEFGSSFVDSLRSTDPDEAAAPVLVGPVSVLSAMIDKMPPKAVLFIMNAHRFLNDDNPAYAQVVWNCRDQFKGNRRTLVMLVPDIKLPLQLRNDVIILDEPYPSRSQLAEIVHRVYDNFKLPKPKADFVEKCVDATSGLAPFTAEQVSFMAAKKELQGIDIEELWERKRKQIEETPGASVHRGKESFSQVVGLKNLIAKVKRILKGRNKIGTILFLDEVEKMFGGIAGDLSGVSQEMFGMMLTWMQLRRVMGVILLGPPGTGKSLIAKCAGNELGIPTIVGDVAGMKAGIIGESTSNLRAFLKMVDAMAGDGFVFVIMTCNKIEALPPELLRRMKNGIYFIDLLNEEERDAAWKFYMKKHELTDKKRPNDEGWTGAEIEACCESAWNENISLVEAAEGITPVIHADRDGIEKLRASAHNRYIAASYAGKFQYKKITQEIIQTKRAVQ